MATHAELKGLCEICLNILKGNIPLSDNNFKKLKRNSKKVLANSNIPLRVNKRVVSQKGGFLGTVASSAIPILSKLLKKRNAVKRWFWSPKINTICY